MGARSSKRVLADVTNEVTARVGNVNVSGRYHRLPRELDDDYQLTGTALGTGQGGSVMMARSRHPGREGQTYAVKSFSLRRLTREARGVLQNEVSVFLRLDHPHVCRLYDIYEGTDSLYMVMECLAGGELHQRLARRCKFSERDAANTTYQMLLAINYIHNMGIVHRDLKLENFLYDAHSSNHLKLIDFGFSCVFDKNQKMKQCCGTLAYMAPEVILKDYTNKCDMWSLGVIVHLLLVGYIPFPLKRDHEETMIGILNCDRVVIPEKWQRVSESATTFVSRLLQRDASQRLSAAEALEHPWIKDRVGLSSCSPLDMSVVDSLCQFAAASRFRRACLHMMAISLTNEELADVRGAFIELDQSKRGTITLHELKAVLEDRFDISDDNCRSIFEALDTNNCDEIHYIDFLAAMMSSRIQVHDGLMRAAFQRFDTLKTGQVNADQLRQVLGEEAFHGSEVEELVQGLEFMPDKSITYESFLEYLVSTNAAQSHQEAATKIIDGEQQRRMRRKSATSESFWDAQMMSPKSLTCHSAWDANSATEHQQEARSKAATITSTSTAARACTASPLVELSLEAGPQLLGTPMTMSSSTAGSPRAHLGTCRPSAELSTLASSGDESLHEGQRHANKHLTSANATPLASPLSKAPHEKSSRTCTIA
mmetsp:Transcript_35577/g.80289  ORF Transcript_35577/g.80289 Transcript_35577/m.80289 type:complete len:654 (+) Transcript_35577:114-2075(+)